METDLGTICNNLLRKGIPKEELSEVSKQSGVSHLGLVPGTKKFSLLSRLGDALNVGSAFILGAIPSVLLYNIYSTIAQKEPSTMGYALGTVVLGSLFLTGIQESDADPQNYGSKAFCSQRMHNILRERYNSLLKA